MGDCENKEESDTPLKQNLCVLCENLCALRGLFLPQSTQNIHKGHKIEKE
jgi:hypothetical protein